MESESQVETTSLLAGQPSGIRTLPSHDDYDDEDFDTDSVENSNSPAKVTIKDKNDKNGTSSSKENNGNISSSFSYGNNGSFVSGEEEFKSPMAGPDEETLEKPIGIGQNEREVESVERNVVDVDDDDVVGSNMKENGSLNSTTLDSHGVEVVNKGDAVVDSTNVDVGEAVRSRVAVVGVEEKQEPTVESVGVTSIAEQSMEVDSMTVGADGLTSTDKGDSVEESAYVDAVESGGTVAEDKKEKETLLELGNEEISAVEESASADSVAVEAAGVKVAEEKDSVVDSINIDVREAVRSGAAIVGEVEERKDSCSAGEEMDNSVGDSAPVLEDSVVGKSDKEHLKPVQADDAKFTSEGDSVVDGVHVDVVEAVRSGVAVVGDSGVEEMETEMKEVGGPVGEKVTLTNDFEPLAGADSSMVSPYYDDHVEFCQPGFSVQIVDVSFEPHIEALANKAETPGLVEIVEQLNNEEIKPETDFESQQHEPVDRVQFVSDGEQEKAQPDHVDDEPQVNSAAVGGETKSDHSYSGVLHDGLNGAASDENHLNESVDQANIAGKENTEEAVDGRKHVLQPEDDGGGSGTDADGNLVFFESESSARKFMEELESHDRSEMIDGQIVTELEEEADTDEEGEGKELFDSAALAALLKAATNAGSDMGTITVTSQDGSRLFSVERPAGLGPSLRSVRPASSANNSSLSTPSSAAASSEESLSDEEKKKMLIINQLRVKFLRLVHRVGQTAEHSLAAQVLYKLALLAGRPTIPAFSIDNAKQTAMQLEAEGKNELDFSLNILVLGKTGVGKSATINSIFGEEKVKINAFEPETISVNEINGIVGGVKIRVMDAPGLRSSAMEQGFNCKVLASVKKLTKKYPPDIMLYVDRLDSQTRDLNDLPMLRTITSCLGSSIWRSTVLTLTHAASAPPDGPSGAPLSYEVFVGQRSHIVQQSIGQVVGDLRFMNLSMMNPVSLVENHPACRKNREGQKVLPNGQAWRSQLLLLCYSLKILAEASSTSKLQDPTDHRKLFGFRVRSPPLPYLLSSLLQPRTHPKLSADQGGDNGDSDIDLDDLSDSDQEEEEDEYDQLPPFKPLRKAQIAKLSRDQRKAYFEEYDYRVKLLQKKQWKEELKRMRDMKKNGKSGLNDYGEMPEDYDAENGAPAAVPVPLPDMVLPPSFDSDNPAYRYRFLEPTSQFLARPVLDTHGWDRDCGYDGVNVEQNLGIAGHFPAAVSLQVTKDKKDFNIHMDSAVSAKHGEDGSSLVGFDVQTIGKQLAYIVRGESKFKNLKKNKTAAGLSVTFLGENVATGVKLEDQIALGKRLVLVGSTGTVRSQKDAAYGANIEVRLREADYPIGQDQSSFVLSLMKWRGDLAVGANLQSQFSVGRDSKMAVRVALNNKQSGQLTIRTTSSDHLAFAYAGLIPIAIALYRKFRPNDSESYSIY